MLTSFCCCCCFEKWRCLLLLFSPFTPVQCLQTKHIHVMRSQNHSHLSNGFLSVDSSWAYSSVFSDVCTVQQHWTAHLSEARAPLHKHIRSEPISEWSCCCCGHWLSQRKWPPPPKKTFKSHVNSITDKHMLFRDLFSFCFQTLKGLRRPSIF